MPTGELTEKGSALGIMIVWVCFTALCGIVGWSCCGSHTCIDACAPNAVQWCAMGVARCK